MSQQYAQTQSGTIFPSGQRWLWHDPCPITANQNCGVTEACVVSSGTHNRSRITLKISTPPHHLSTILSKVGKLSKLASLRKVKSKNYTALLTPYCDWPCQSSQPDKREVITFQYLTLISHGDFHQKDAIASAQRIRRLRSAAVDLKRLQNGISIADFELGRVFFHIQHLHLPILYYC